MAWLEGEMEKVAKSWSVCFLSLSPRLNSMLSKKENWNVKSNEYFFFLAVAAVTFCLTPVAYHFYVISFCLANEKSTP
jgi:hypothetical protein